MAFPLLLFVLSVLIYSPSPSSSKLHSLSKGSSLSVEKSSDVLMSSNGVFSAGFYGVGENAYCFAIWFTEPLHDGNLTIVWMANRDKPINGRSSKLSLLRTGNLVLTDGRQPHIWATETDSSAHVILQLNDTGNLFLQTMEDEHGLLWQSFDSPTHTLLPNQLLTRDTSLISSRSQTNHSSGFYKLYFDNDNVLRLIYNGLSESSIYWPDPEMRAWEANRSTYDSLKIAVLDSYGRFNSSDKYSFTSADFGLGPQRRLTLDEDGNPRAYSYNRERKTWDVTWQALLQPCKIHGICGANSLCTYVPESGRKCSCIHGHKMVNHKDWAYGCEPEYNLDWENVSFIELRHVDFFGYDSRYLTNYTFQMCEEECINQFGNCIGFLYKDESPNGNSLCYTKYKLVNGYRNPYFRYAMHVKFPKSVLASYQNLVEVSNLNCSGEVTTTELSRTYEAGHENEFLKFILIFALTFGGFQFICILFFLYMSRGTRTTQSYQQIVTGFKRFTYAELKKASSNFSQEIGEGGYGVVYKGVLTDNRIAAIKRLKQADQGEAEFLTEVSTIGRLNHMNLIETWGYCVEGKHRILIFEYMDNGSLADALYSKGLDWEKRYNIAVGTAKGLDYLHEECSEWVLHCDVKPQNILLGSNYEPKVADFGLSKLLKRGGIGNQNFSRIRGTRGYMAPEWVLNLPITSKVDVYSYGVVMLEMITGKSPQVFHASSDNGGTEQTRLTTWVREKMRRVDGTRRDLWIEEIVDPKMEGEYDKGRMEVLIEVALQCAEEDKDARPTMRQVVDRLLHQENDD